MSDIGLYIGGSHSERTRSRSNKSGVYPYQARTANQDDGETALSIFNHIKEQYALKIDELNELKRQVFIMASSSHNSDGGQYILDHQARSKLRILIESLLIDLNEEIFSLSEELARSFAGYRSPSNNGVLARAYEYEQRKNAVMRKISTQIDDNHSVKLIRRHAKIVMLSTSPK